MRIRVRTPCAHINENVRGGVGVAAPSTWEVESRDARSKLPT